MASHGGMIGVIIACILFAKKHGINYVYLLDLTAIVGPIGIFFGRIANFINGELVGRVTTIDNPLAVKFPTDILNWPNYEFNRLNSLESVVDKVGITTTQLADWIRNFNTDGTARDGVYNALFKVVHQIQNGNTAIKDAIAPVLDPRYPSQLFTAAGEGLFLFLVLFFLARKAHRPGFICGVGIMVYALIRIVDEHFRTPDAHLGFQLFGLTRGQWLSVGMIIVGILLIFYWTRTQSQTVNGWLRGENVKYGRR